MEDLVGRLGQAGDLVFRDHHVLARVEPADRDVDPAGRRQADLGGVLDQVALASGDCVDVFVTADRQLVRR